jgi:alkanesulfonate monooxygenase SsuD/methylene tetrahydromethanopterin reductase-like flavin-dependent oxidoreductase (luciferase family)
VDQEALARAVATEDWATAAVLVDDEAVRRHAASGTAEQVRARIAAYGAAGLDEVVLAGMRDLEETRRTLAAVADREETR